LISSRRDAREGTLAAGVMLDRILDLGEEIGGITVRSDARWEMDR
jgi:hypothetical protein